MKKTVIFFISILIIVSFVSYRYIGYKITAKKAQNENYQYASYDGKEIYGTDLATLINRAVDDNKKNNIDKDQNGIYKDNGKDSVRIEVKFTDDDKVHNIEEIYNSGTEKFMELYNQIRFKCTKVEYHEKTKKVSYMFFEQMET